jgi:ribulose-5-phosphate 4-epimerase/fuculose-1-phosphate aldolase
VIEEVSSEVVKKNMLGTRYQRGDKVASAEATMEGSTPEHRKTATAEAMDAAEREFERFHGLITWETTVVTIVHVTRRVSVEILVQS